MKPGAVAAASGGAVAFSWEHEAGVSKQSPTAAAARKQQPAEEKAAAMTKKAPHRIRVRPPPGAPGRGGGAVVRPEEDPFLAAFLACTERGKNKATKEPGIVKGGQKLLGLGLGIGSGLSCKGPGGVMQSVVRLAKVPQAMNDD